MDLSQEYIIKRQTRHDNDNDNDSDHDDNDVNGAINTFSIFNDDRLKIGQLFGIHKIIENLLRFPPTFSFLFSFEAYFEVYFEAYFKMIEMFFSFFSMVKRKTQTKQKQQKRERSKIDVRTIFSEKQIRKKKIDKK